MPSNTHPEASERRKEPWSYSKAWTHSPPHTTFRNTKIKFFDSRKGSTFRAWGEHWVWNKFPGLIVFVAVSLYLHLTSPSMGRLQNLESHPHIPCHRPPPPQQKPLFWVSPVSFFPLKPFAGENKLLKGTNLRVDFWWWPKRGVWSEVRKGLTLSSVY